ncbi:MAG: ABC transporter permease [Bacteroidales bacterium]
MGEELSERLIAYVDPEFFEMFTVPMVNGSYETITDRNNIIISQELASILFGETNPLGKPVSIINDSSKEFVYTVTGVFRDFPENSSFTYEIISVAGNFLNMWNVNDTDWRLWTNATFVQVSQSASTTTIREMLNRYLPIQNRARKILSSPGSTWYR